MFKTIIDIAFLAVITMPIGILFLTLVYLMGEEMRRSNTKIKKQYNDHIANDHVVKHGKNERPMPLRRVK